MPIGSVTGDAQQKVFGGEFATGPLDFNPLSAVTDSVVAIFR
jgi:hypothetical protein